MDDGLGFETRLDTRLYDRDVFLKRYSDRGRGFVSRNEALIEPSLKTVIESSGGILVSNTSIAWCLMFLFINKH